MKRRTAVLAAALAAAVLICAAFLLWQRAHAQSAVTAAVYQYGEPPSPWRGRTGRKMWWR